MCYTHAAACGGGTAAFLLTKLTRLLVIRKNRYGVLGEGGGVRRRGAGGSSPCTSCGPLSSPACPHPCPARPCCRSATFLPSPYVDAHGEEDPRLQRGK